MNLKVKKCGTCNTVKSLSEFNKNKSKKDGLNTICRDCSKDRSKRFYRENKEKHIVDIMQRKKKRIVRNKKMRSKYLKKNPCVDCGNTNEVVLDFDHVRGVKESSISNLVNNGYAWGTIMKEINKCEVRCANCHRIKTHERRIASVA